MFPGSQPDSCADASLCEGAVHQVQTKEIIPGFFMSQQSEKCSSMRVRPQCTTRVCKGGAVRYTRPSLCGSDQTDTQAWASFIPLPRSYGQIGMVGVVGFDQEHQNVKREGQCLRGLGKGRRPRRRVGLPRVGLEEEEGEQRGCPAKAAGSARRRRSSRFLGQRARVWIQAFRE